VSGMTPEPCAWCPPNTPSAEQVYMGTRYTDTGPVRLYSWLCDQCTREAAREREASVAS
jgi:hypothetical protein